MTIDAADEGPERRGPPPLPPEAGPGSVGPQAPLNPLGSLLKAPGSLIRRMQQDENLSPLAAQLLLWGLVFHAGYGFAMGLFDSAGVACMTAGKAPMIALCSLLLCMPSLYVFSCVAGMPVTLTQAFGLGAATVAMAGLLLLGLAPVSWLFSVSTSSVAFVVIMNVLAWGIAVGFVFRFFGLMAMPRNAQKTTGLRWWLVVYVVVSLQMATTMRPLLSPPAQGWVDTGKKFFLVHFKDCVFGEQKSQPVKAR